METTIGIDLGTTFSAVSTVDEHGRAIILKNANGESLTPSVIYYGGDAPIIGSEAKEMQEFGEDNVAAFYKRNMGDPFFMLHFKGKDYSAEELSSIFLKKLKADAELALGKPCNKAVITVPAYFSNAQREATVNAGKNAGLEVLRIINEPTAAAIAFGLNQIKEQTVLVYDLGGGTFDVTIIQITKEEIKVIGTDGNHELGGKNWDDRIVNFVAEQFEEEFGVNPLEDNATFNDLLVRAENAKKQLSSKKSARVVLAHDGDKGRYELTVDAFETLTKDLLEQSQMLTEQLIKEVGLDWASIDGVLLVGGSTRMPMVSRWVMTMSGKEPLRGINVDEAVALGAAIQANLDANGADPIVGLTLGGRKIRDVMSHSMGMVAENEDRSKYLNSIIIPKNNPIPSTQTRPYQVRTHSRGQNEFEVYMLQGESDRPLDCNILGKYVFSGIVHEQDTLSVVDVTYAYDSNGIVEVAAKQRSNGQPLALRIEPLPEDLSWLDGVPKDEEVTIAHLSVLIAVDLSGSMSGVPLQKAKEAAQGFIEKLDLANTSIGLMAFADTVHLNQNLCQNGKLLEKGIQSWSIGSVGYGNATQPFTDTLNILGEREDPRYLIVLTDGVWSNQRYAIQQADRCKENGIEIIAIGFDGADKKFLKQIATSDENALMTNLGDLATSFSKIAQVLTETGGQTSKSRGLKFF